MSQLAISAAKATANYFLPGSGNAAGMIMKKITGSGAYRLNQNSIMNTSTSIPTFSGIGEGTLVEHREYIGDLLGSTGFVNTTYNLNPGLSQTFPWLSYQTSGYTAYKFEGLVACYKPTSGMLSGSSNPALGTVIMATNYNSAESAYTSKIQMEQAEFCTSGVSCEPLLHPIECKPSLTILPEKYIRYGSLPSNADIHLYDQGVLQIATQGQPSNATPIGEIWLTYKVRLFTPRIPPSEYPSTPYSHYSLKPLANNSSGNIGNQSNFLPLGGNMPLTWSSAASFSVPLPGEYLVTYIATASSALSGTLVTSTTPSGCVNPVTYNTNGLTYFQVASSTSIMFQQSFIITQPNTVINLSGVSMTTTVVGGDLFVNTMAVGFGDNGKQVYSEQFSLSDDENEEFEAPIVGQPNHWISLPRPVLRRERPRC